MKFTEKLVGKENITDEMRLELQNVGNESTTQGTFESNLSKVGLLEISTTAHCRLSTYKAVVKSSLIEGW